MIIKEMKELEKILKENSGLLSRIKERDGNKKLNEICKEIFKKELMNCEIEKNNLNK